MPEIGRDDPEYWLKMLMGLAIESNRLGKQLRDEELLCDPDGSVRAAKLAVYGFECECNARNVQLIQSAVLKHRERKLLKLRYLKKTEWKDVYRFIGTEMRYAYRLHKRALNRVLAASQGRDFKSEYNTEKRRLDALNPYTQ